MQRAAADQSSFIVGLRERGWCVGVYHCRGVYANQMPGGYQGIYLWFGGPN